MKLTGKKALITGGNTLASVSPQPDFSLSFSESLAARTASDARGRSILLRRL
jgi:hypothetical protein